MLSFKWLLPLRFFMRMAFRRWFIHRRMLRKYQLWCWKLSHPLPRGLMSDEYLIHSFIYQHVEKKNKRFGSYARRSGREISMPIYAPLLSLLLVFFAAAAAAALLANLNISRDSLDNGMTGAGGVHGPSDRLTLLSLVNTFIKKSFSSFPNRSRFWYVFFQQTRHFTGNGDLDFSLSWLYTRIVLWTP